MGIIGGGYLIVEGCVGDYREQLPGLLPARNSRILTTAQAR